MSSAGESPSNRRFFEPHSYVSEDADTILFAVDNGVIEIKGQSLFALMDQDGFVFNDRDEVGVFGEDIKLAQRIS